MEIVPVFVSALKFVSLKYESLVKSESVCFKALLMLTVKYGYIKIK